VRLWNRSNSPRLYKVLGFEEAGRSITDAFGTWSIQATEPANLITRLGLIIKKQAEKQLTADEKNAISDEMDGWEREWRAQTDNQ
jgi:hypothetical protein